MIRIHDQSVLRLFLEDEKGFEALIIKLHKEHGLDFGTYRKKCLKRRIWTRVSACGLKTYIEYIAFLNRHPKEYEALLDAMTINVTEFLRNPEAFQYLKTHILPAIIQSKEQSNRKIIRIWSAGCSSGEEPYSIAILLHEILGKKIHDFIITIYGTDIDRNCLGQAKEGVYSEHLLKEISRAQLNNFFSPAEAGFAVSDQLRILTKFRYHNLVNDPPIKHVDLIICRNVLIYFNRSLQGLVFQKFYDALNVSGYLMLGKTESLWAASARLFENVSNSERIYQKNLN